MGRNPCTFGHAEISSVDCCGVRAMRSRQFAFPYNSMVVFAFHVSCSLLPERVALYRYFPVVVSEVMFSPILQKSHNAPIPTKVSWCRCSRTQSLQQQRLSLRLCGSISESLPLGSRTRYFRCFDASTKLPIALCARAAEMLAQFSWWRTEAVG